MKELGLVYSGGLRPRSNTYFGGILVFNLSGTWNWLTVSFLLDFATQKLLSEEILINLVRIECHVTCGRGDNW